MHLQNTAAEVKGLAAGSLVALTTLQSRRGERREAFSYFCASVTSPLN